MKGVRLGCLVPLFARCSLLLRESPPEFARPATHFLCWCKESGQRKHLTTHLASSQSASLSALHAPRLARPGLEQFGFARTRASIQRASNTAPPRTAWKDGAMLDEWIIRVREPCKTELLEPGAGELGSCCGGGVVDVLGGAPVKWVLRCFLCPLSLHQQRKWVAGRANSGGLSRRTRAARAHSGTRIQAAPSPPPARQSKQARGPHA